MPDNELSLILLVHVLNKHLQKNSAFLAHSKLPLTTVLADFVSTLTNYEKAFDHPPQNSTLNASDLSEIIEKSALKTSFTINPENGGELVFSSPIKQIQSTLLNVVVESSVKYGKTLLGQLQGLKDEYHTNSLENESIVEPSEPVSEVSDQAQASENETPENSANIISEGARKTESPLESGPAEEDEMEVDVENVEQDSTPIEPVQEAAEIEPEITLDVETKESLEPEEIKEIDIEVHKSEDPQSEEVQDEEVQDKQEIEAVADQEEEAAEDAAEEAAEEAEEEEAGEEADEVSEIEAETANLSEPQAEVEIEAENVENKEEKDEDEEVVNDEIIDHEEKEENIPKTEGEAENSSSDDEEENGSSREGDDSVSDEIERSSRLLLEESERDQEEVDHIEKPQLADVDIDTEAETSDHGEKEEEEQEEEQEEEEKEEEQEEEQEEEEKEEEDSKDDAKQGELEAVSILNKETKEEVVQDPESEHVKTTNTETTIPELVGSEPLGEKSETPVTEEKERDNVTEESEEQPSQESEEIQEPEPEPAPKAKPQEKSKPAPPSTRRKRKIEETSQEPVQPETPKKPRKAKETSVASRRKSTASEQILTPAQKYKRFQNIAINFIKSIEAHRCSSPFLTAITAPEYTSVVKQPQDLKTIMKNVKKRHDLAVYTTVKELERDVMLMFTNCVMFNKSSTPLVKMAQEMKEDVRNTFKMFEDTEKGLA